MKTKTSVQKTNGMEKKDRRDKTLIPFIAALLFAAAGMNAAVQRAVMKDSSLWGKKPIPPHSEKFEIIVVIDDGSEWVSMLTADLENRGNNDRQVCIEGRVKDIKEGPERTVVKLFGSDREFILRKVSHAEGFSSNDHVALCGRTVAYGVGEGTGCYLLVFKMLRLLTPADKRYNAEYQSYKNTKNWQAILDLIKRVKFQAKSDPVNHNKYLRMIRRWWPGALRLKTNDPDTTDLKNPEDLYKRAMEFIKHTSSPRYPRELVRLGLEIDPDHPGCRQLQPQVWPDGRLLNLPDEDPPVRMWLDSGDYDAKLAEIERAHEQARLAAIRSKEEYEKFLLKREPKRYQIIFQTITGWKSDPDTVEKTTETVINKYFRAKDENDQRLLQQLVLAALQNTDEDTAIRIFTAAAVHPEPSVRRDAVEALVWLNSGKSLAAVENIIRDAKDPELKSELIADSVNALSQQPTENSVRTLVRMAQDKTPLLARQAIGKLNMMTQQELATGKAWKKWFSSHGNVEDLLIHPYDF